VNEAVRAALTVDPACPAAAADQRVRHRQPRLAWAFGQPDTLEQTLLDIVNPRR